MNRFVVILGTTHELQGAEKRGGIASDLLYMLLLKRLIVDERIDFIFEEATGLGPTIAEDLSLSKLGPDRYWDVDPPRGEREKFGIPTQSNDPFMVGSPPVAAFANWLFNDVHARREELWIERVRKQDFKRALMICGENHTLSFAFRLTAANFAVKSVTF